jgi:hypothetical protein
MVVKGFFAEAVGAKNLLPKLIAAIIGLYFALCAGWILVNRIVAVAAIRKVITRDEAVTIQNLFSSRTIRWEDITEFGTYTVGFHGSGVST